MATTAGLSPVAGERPDRGVPVVLLHGIYGTGTLYDGLRSVIDADRYLVVTPDLPGHGANAAAGPLDAVAVAEALLPVLTAAGPGGFHLVGHSHGGAAAQVVARRLPGLVRSLVLVSAYTYQPLSWWERAGGRLAPAAVRLAGTPLLALAVRLTRSGGGGRRLSAVAAGDLARQLGRNDARRMARALRDARAFDSRPWLPEIAVPTLVVTGDADRLVSPRQSALLAAGIPGARLEIIGGAGHIPPLSHPDAFTALLLGWLDEHAPPATP